jgi:hypothetical protein
MKARPWIWLIVLQLVVIAALTTMVVIAHRYPQLEVPLQNGR